jgi:hypothetical protein
MGGGGRKAAAAREEASSLHHERLKFSGSLKRNGRTAVIPENVRLSALILRIGGFNRDRGLEARGKSSAIGKLNLDVRTIMAVFKDGEDANDFAGEFFAFDHGDVPRCDRARVGQSVLHWNETKRQMPNLATFLTISLHHLLRVFGQQVEQA